MANQPPVAINDSYSLLEDEVLKVPGGGIFGVLNNDTDSDDAKLAAALLNGPENPLFDINTNGNFTYDARYHGTLYVDPDGADDGTLVDPADDDNEFELPNGFDSLAEGAVITDTFTYEAFDGQDSDDATVTIVVTGVNDDPVAVDDAATVSSGQMVTFAVVDDDTDVDIWPAPDTLSATLLSDVDDGNGGAASADGTTITTDAGGTVEILGSGEIKYTAAAGFFGIDTFEYTVSDQNGGSDTGLVRVTVLPANADPTAVDDSYTIGEDAGATLFDDPTVLDNDSDPDSGDLLGAQLCSVLRRVDAGGNPIAGNTGILVDFNVDGTFTYNPNGEFEDLAEGESAFVAFDYDGFDAEGNPSKATVTIEIQGANDPVSGNIPIKNATVFEAGLADGSTDGDTTIMRTFDFTADLQTLALSDPEGDAIFLVRIDNNGEGVVATAPGDTLQGSNGTGTFELLDNFNNLTGAAGADGLVDGVKYTLTDSDEHADIAGHNGLIFDLLNLGFTDGTLNGGSTAYVLDFTSSGGTNNVTGAQAEIFDDIPLLGPDGPDATVGDDLDNGTVLFSENAMDTDTFSFIEGADDAALHFTGKPSDFMLIDGRTVTSSVSADGLTITGVDSDGGDFYTLELIDGTPGDGEFTHKFTLLQGPPTVINPIDFSSISAGGPQEEPIVENIKFDGAFFTKDPDGTTEEEDIFNSLDDHQVLQDEDINPNNAGGIGIGNGNIDQEEVLCIDVTGSPVAISGVRFILQGNGGGVSDVVDVLWVAVDSGSIVAQGTETTTDINARKTFDLDGDGRFETNGEAVFVEPGVEFDQLYVAINPDGPSDSSGLDSSDTVRINNIATIQEVLSPDIILPFSVQGFEDLNNGIDGDVTQEESFTWTINGPDDVTAPIAPAEMDILVF